jgi:glutathione S-transferase
LEELTGQRWVPVLVHDDQVINDSKRICEYIDHLQASQSAAPVQEAG